MGGSPAHAAAHAQMFYTLVISETYQNMRVVGGKKEREKDSIVSSLSLFAVYSGKNEKNLHVEVERFSEGNMSRIVLCLSF